YNATQPQNGEGAEYGDGRTQQNTERQRPAFVQGREDQENEEQRESKDHRRGYALLRLFLLERHSHVVIAHLRRHGLIEYLLEGLHGLRGAIARCGGAVELRGPVHVEAHGEFRTGTRFDLGQRGKRHHFTFVVPYVELPDVFGLGAI